MLFTIGQQGLDKITPQHKDGKEYAFCSLEETMPGQSETAQLTDSMATRRNDASHNEYAVDLPPDTAVVLRTNSRPRQLICTTPMAA